MDIPILPVIDELPIAKLDKIGLQRRLDLDPCFERGLRDEFDVSDEVVEKIKQRIEEEEANCVLEFFGVGGTAKTNTQFVLSYKYLFPKLFSMKNVFFGKTDLLSNAPNLPKKSTVALDENVLEYGMGSQRLQYEFENIINVCRKYQLSITACSVVPRLKEWAHYAFETIFVDRKEGINRVMVYQPEVLGVTAGYRELGWISVPDARTILPPEFWVEYDAKKDSFINSALHQEDGGDFISQAASHVLASKEWNNLAEFYQNKKTARLPPKEEVLEVVTTLFPYLRRNNEAKQIVVTTLMRAKLSENVPADAGVKNVSCGAEHDEKENYGKN